MSTKKKSFGKELVGHFQSGVSYMIPLVTAAGLLTSIAVIAGGADVWNQTDTFWGVLRLIGQTGLQFICPMIAAYVSYSIADRPGLAPAFITGIIANQMGTGFLGGMICGVCVGYLVQALKKIPMPVNLTTVKSLLLIPFVATAAVGLGFWYVLGVPIQVATNAITAWLSGMSGANAALLGAILGAMMAFDMGGPVNKVAFAFGMAAFTSGQYLPSTLMLLGIGLPPTIMFLATLLDRSKQLYSDAERDAGKTAIIMGAVGITEGTIPFAVADPVRVIPSIMVGTAVSGAIAGSFGVSQQTALATYMAIPFASNPLLYIVAIVAGGFVGALMVNALKMIKYKKEHAGEAKA